VLLARKAILRQVDAMHREFEFKTIYTETSPVTPIRIVAAVNRTDEGVVFDWAAYIGCGTTEMVALHGEKLLASQAAAFFPHLPLDLYRE